MTAHPSDAPTMNRRRFCTAAATTAVAAGVGVSTARAQSDSSDFEAWFADVTNYDGVVDATGQSEVRINVGAKTAAGPYGFGPPAVRIDPGTTVVWEWTGQGSPHDVTAVDGSFGSELVSEAGATFQHTFDDDGVFQYYCTPHKALGMKGAVVVGDVAVGEAGGNAASGEPDYGDWFDDVGNYDGTVDARGQSAVTVEVGVNVDGVPFGFGPAAIRVDPGTTVTWEWTGEGSPHDVTAVDGSFGSELLSEAGATFQHTFETQGVHEYFCTPHRSLGMKGAVVVGDAGGNAGAGGAGGADLRETILVGGLTGLVLTGLFLVPIAELRRGGRKAH